MRLPGVVTTTVLLLLLGVGLVAAENITSNFHVNLQFTNASGQIENGTWNLTFNLSRNDNCSDIVYTNNTDVVADSRGIVSVTLQNITGNFSEQLWLCYERNGTLKANHRLAQVPYAFYAANVSAAGVQNTSALNLTGQPGAFTNLSIGDFWLTSANLSFLVSRLLNLSLFVPGNVTNLTHVSNLTNDRNYTNVSALSADLALTNASGGAGGVNFTHLSNFTNDRNYTNVSALIADLKITNASGGAGGVNFTHLSNFTNNMNYTNVTGLLTDLLLRNFSNALTAYINNSQVNSVVQNQTLPAGGVNYTDLSNFTNNRNYTNVSALINDLQIVNSSGGGAGGVNFTHLSNFTNNMNYTRNNSPANFTPFNLLTQYIYLENDTAQQSVLWFRTFDVNRGSWFWDNVTSRYSLGTYTDLGAFNGYAFWVNAGNKTARFYGNLIGGGNITGNDTLNIKNVTATQLEGNLSCTNVTGAASNICTLTPGAGGVNYTHLSNFTNDRNYTNITAIAADLQLTNGSADGNTITDPAGLYQNTTTLNVSRLNVTQNGTINNLSVGNLTANNATFESTITARGNISMQNVTYITSLRGITTISASSFLIDCIGTSTIFFRDSNLTTALRIVCSSNSVDIGSSLKRTTLNVYGNITNPSTVTPELQLDDEVNITKSLTVYENATIHGNTSLDNVSITTLNVSNFNGPVSFRNVTNVPNFTNESEINALIGNGSADGNTITDPASSYPNTSLGSLANITNVSVTLTPASGAWLRYNGSASRWEAANESVLNTTIGVWAVTTLTLRNYSNTVTAFINSSQVNAYIDNSSQITIPQVNAQLVNRTFFSNLTNDVWTFLSNFTNNRNYTNVSALGADLQLFNGTTIGAVNAQLVNLTTILNLTNGTTHLVSYGNLTGGPFNLTTPLNMTNRSIVGVGNLTFERNATVNLTNGTLSGAWNISMEVGLGGNTYACYTWSNGTCKIETCGNISEYTCLT